MTLTYILTIIVSVIGLAVVRNEIDAKTVFSKTHKFVYPAVDFTLADAVRDDVLYNFFNKDIPEGIYLTEDTVGIENLARNIPTKIVIHGWLSNETTYWYRPIRDAYFSIGEHNVIFIDWSAAGSKSYEVSAANTKPVGEFIGDFILTGKFDLEKVHVIGHSLGSHVAGFVGKHIFEEASNHVSRITGTDPAAPMFEVDDLSSEYRLASSDANFVDIIHTDAGHYGFVEPIGQVDFYPNGGTNQPGCPPIEEDDNCSHARSNWYFIESITSNDFQATECDFWEIFVNGGCSNNSVITFGENVPNTARGVYFFKTNSESPFAVGSKVSG